MVLWNCPVFCSFQKIFEQHQQIQINCHALMWFQWWRQLKTEIDSRRNADFLQSAALDKIQLYIFSQSPVFTRTYKSHSANKNPVASASLKFSHISMMQIFPIRKLKQTSQESRTVLENYSLFIYKKTALSARCSKLYKTRTLAVKYQ